MYPGYISKLAPGVAANLLRRSCLLYQAGATRNKCLKPDLSKTCKSLVECGPCSKHKYMDARCKVAIVTGGVSGIGLSTVSELLCQEAYRVVLVDINADLGPKIVEILNKEHGPNRACFVPADVNIHEDFADVFLKTHEMFGGVDIVVNNASIIMDEKWELEFDTNLKSVFRGTLLGLEWLQKAKKTMEGGVIVNVASCYGIDSLASAPSYTAGKHGVVGLTRSFGSPEHFRENGIRVVGMCPGITNSGLFKNDDDEAAEPKGVSPKLKTTIETDFKKTPRQKPIAVARGINYLIMYASSGSIWAVENSELYRLFIPDRKSYSVIVDNV